MLVQDGMLIGANFLKERKYTIMSEQMKSSKEKMVMDFIQRVNPNEQQFSLSFDLRGYAKYVKENGLQAKEVTTEIMQMFSVKK